MASLLYIFVLLVSNVLAGVNLYIEVEKSRRGKEHLTEIDLKHRLNFRRLGSKLTGDIGVVATLPKHVTHLINIVKSKCSEGNYYKADSCNLCYCMQNTLHCTAVKCTTVNTRLNAKVLKESGEPFYQKLRDAATKCTPGTDKVVIDGNDHCPCTCIIPSVAYCPICPAVERFIIPRKNKTQDDVESSESFTYLGFCLVFPIYVWCG